MPSMKVDGACFCGDLTYEAEIDPETVLLCHCTDCQTLGSGAFRVVVPAIAGTFRLLSGQPTIYRQGRRQRQPPPARLLSDLRHGNLFGAGRWRRRAFRPARQHAAAVPRPRPP